MRVLLADPPKLEEHYDLSYPNLGILYLTSYLRQHSPAPVTVRYLEGHCTLDEHLAEIERFQPDVYGLSFALWTSELAYRTLRAVKARFPKLPVVCGGPQPTASHEEALTRGRADVCVLGEGEVTFTELVEHFRNGSPALEQIPGLAFRGADGTTRVTAKRAFIRDLDTIPLPAWGDVDLTPYTGMHINKAKPQMHILVSRGCPYDCNFCANPVWKYNKPWIRMRSAQNIAREVDVLYARGVREIYMTSDEFNVKESWAIDVCKAIEALGHRDLYFQCNLRADVISDDLAKAFRRINLWMVHLGIESGNQRTLDGIGKHTTLEQVEHTCRVLQAQGISVFGFVMLYHAWEEDGRLRWEDNDDVGRTLGFCRRLLASGLIQYMSWQVATPMPGSRLHALAAKYCLIPDRVIDNPWTHNLLLPGIGAGDVRSSVRKGMLLKDWYLLKNGNINVSHLWRAWTNVRVLLGLEPNAAKRSRRAPAR
jgi:radical SAM superfamily enzyme YgiQ (UPF0313 family)